MPLNRFTGKIAIITASTMGIGYAIAERLAKEGATVIISSRRAENVEEATKKLKSQGLNAYGLVCHVAKAEDRKKLFDQAKALGGLDILISNAAVNPHVGVVFECSEEKWDKIFEVNVKSAFLLAKEALPLLRKSKAGRIIFMSSIVGLQPTKLIGPYSVSKTALLGLTKTAALQLAPENITVNCVAPGTVITKFAEAVTHDPDQRNIILGDTPLKRYKTPTVYQFGYPHEISGVVAFLASDDGSFTTGEIYAVAGGVFSRL